MDESTPEGQYWIDQARYYTVLHGWDFTLHVAETIESNAAKLIVLRVNYAIDAIVEGIT